MECPGHSYLCTGQNLVISLTLKLSLSSGKETRIHLVIDLRPAAITTTKKIINKLIINQDVLLRTPITQVRRQIKDD
jgi:hypothetical protein